VVTIRLARRGGKKNPFYHVTVAEKSAKRDGRFIERLGFYNPVARGRDQKLRIDLERVDYWLSNGAQASERVKQLVAQSRKGLDEVPADDAADPVAADNEAAATAADATVEDAEATDDAEAAATDDAEAAATDDPETAAADDPETAAADDTETGNAAEPAQETPPDDVKPDTA